MNFLFGLYAISLLVLHDLCDAQNTNTSNFSQFIFPIFFTFFLIKILCVAHIRNKRNEIEDNDNVVFKLADLVIEHQLANGKIIQIEAFKSLSNDAIIAAKDNSKYGELHWLSLGYPSIEKSTTSELFHFSNQGFYILVEMLNDLQKELFAKRAKAKYNIDVKTEQITTLIVSKFSCKIELKCENKNIFLTGHAYNLRELPIRLNFNYDKSTERYSECIQDQLSNPKSDIEIKCEASKSSKAISSNTFSVNFESSQLNELVNQLFGPASSVYVSRTQLDEFSSKIYSNMNVFEQYEMDEDSFRAGFLDDLIKQTADQAFQHVPFQDAINGISKFNIEGDIKPDEIYSEFSKIFDVKTENDKQHIISNKEHFQRLYEHKDINGRAGGFASFLDVFGFGVSYEVGVKLTTDWAKSGKKFDDQLKELNKFTDNTVEWKFDGKKIVPKSLNVAKINKSKFQKKLTFFKIKNKLSDHLFIKKISLVTKKYEKIIKLKSFRDSTMRINEMFKGVILTVSGNVIERYFFSGKGTQIYEGWYLCNGENNTPDLKGKFLVGLDASHSDYSSPGKTGGMDKVTLSISQMPSHTHQDTGHYHSAKFLTNSTGYHSHDYWDVFHSEYPGACKSCHYTDTPYKVGGDGGTDRDNVGFQIYRQTNGDGVHQHSIEGITDSATAYLTHIGNDQPFDNRPSFYVVAYIIYLG